MSINLQCESACGSNSELRYKVNSLNDSRKCCDPEIARSSGLSHVPSHPMSIPNRRGMLSRDSCLQPDTRNSFGISGTVFEDLLAERANELDGEQHSEVCNTHTEICKEVFNWESSLSCRRSLSAELHG